jgi:hypothetical protein
VEQHIGREKLEDKHGAAREENAGRKLLRIETERLWQKAEYSGLIV